ncbi:MAG: hypothetical protein OXN17_19665 [Candidatus Poribacteria bacterium]|nr:hypothetical protein [Candidatus Poribacteria bacterium]MDE0504018.1 hypothetical protein [Candidatus Poribacteria bacterium]
MSTAIHSEPTDTVLIARFQSSEAGVFDRRHLRHRDRIHGVIRSIIAGPYDALDLTQEVFLNAYQKLSAFQHAAQFYSWLYRIAVNQCIDYMLSHFAVKTQCAH